jgi:hypothetical protein
VPSAPLGAVLAASKRSSVGHMARA